MLGGIEAARGRYVIMGDADDSYDFLEVPRFVGRAAEGYDLVQGCRLPSGGGTVMPGAMPWLAPLGRQPDAVVAGAAMFGCPIHDIYCGMRGFTQRALDAPRAACTGMEFATEMIIKASLFGQRIGEVPITLSPGRPRSRRPHLRTFRDGWRTLRFFLIFSPRWLFWYSGLIAHAPWRGGLFDRLPGLTLAGATFDAHTLVIASMLLQLGAQSAMFAVLTTTYAIKQGFRPSSPRVDRFFELFTLERGAVAGLAGMALGLLIILAATVAGTGRGSGRSITRRPCAW